MSYFFCTLHCESYRKIINGVLFFRLCLCHVIPLEKQNVSIDFSFHIHSADPVPRFLMLYFLEGKKAKYRNFCYQ